MTETQATPESRAILGFKHRLRDDLGLVPFGPVDETWYSPTLGKAAFHVDIGYVYREIKVRIYLDREQVDQYDITRADPTTVLGIIRLLLMERIDRRTE